MEFDRKYKSRGLVSIGVALDDAGWAAVRPYLAAHPISYPIVAGDAAFAKRYNIASLPVTLLIDRDGRVADAHVGMVVKDAWAAEIRQLLRERAK
jgi:hypothetical protein